MADDSRLIPRDNGNGNSNGFEVLPSSALRYQGIELSPREPHLYDYLLILRKHQWLILAFMVAVVAIVSIPPFRMRPVYVATAKLLIDRENPNILPFQGGDSYAYETDMDNFMETQSKILTSETLAL